MKISLLKTNRIAQFAALPGLFLMLILTVSAHAHAREEGLQGSTSGHSASLTWTASSDGGTVNVYRAAGACSPASTFSQVANNVPAAGPYSDSTIPVGASCYQVTAFVGGAESAPSNQLTLTVLPSPPSGLSGTAK